MSNVVGRKTPLYSYLLWFQKKSIILKETLLFAGIKQHCFFFMFQYYYIHFKIFRIVLGLQRIVRAVQKVSPSTPSISMVLFIINELILLHYY